MKKGNTPPIQGGPTFSLRHRLFRLIWIAAWAVLCSWTPPTLSRWRCGVLRLFGAKIGIHCDIRRTAKIWYPPNLFMEDWTVLADGVNCYNVAPITLKTGALVSQGAYLCTASHNIYTPAFTLIAKPIVLERQCWIASEAFIGPGVTAGEGVVLGARAAAFENLQEWSIYRGNPAVWLKRRPRQPMKQLSQSRSTGEGPSSSSL